MMLFVMEDNSIIFYDRVIVALREISTIAYRDNTLPQFSIPQTHTINLHTFYSLWQNVEASKFTARIVFSAS